MTGIKKETVMKILPILLLLFECSFAQSNFSEIQFHPVDSSAHLRYFQAAGEDTTMIAEFLFDDGRVTSPARDSVLIDSYLDAFSNIRDLDYFVSGVRLRGWESVTNQSNYRYDIEMFPNRVVWELEIDSVATKVRYNNNTGITKFWERPALDYSWTDFVFYVSIYQRHFDLVRFKQQ